MPLCEIVSEPDVRSAEEAAEYVRAIRTLVRYLGIGDGNMEEGSLRCDANVSLRPRGATALGTKTEIKNMNSFKNVRDAIEHEVKRQAARPRRGRADHPGDAALGRDARGDAGDALEGAGARLPLLPRARSAAAGGHRRATLAALRDSLPELPEDRFARYTGPVGLSPQDAGVLVAEREIAAYYDAAVAAGAPAKRAANWVINEVLARVGDARRLGDADVPVPPAALAGLVTLVENGTLSGKLGKDVFAKMWTERRDGGRHRRGGRSRPGVRRWRAGGGLQARHRRPSRRGARIPFEPEADGLLRRRRHEGDRRQGEPQGGQRDLEAVARLSEVGEQGGSWPSATRTSGP